MTNPQLVDQGVESKWRILRAIKQYIDEKGWPPTTRDLGKMVNLAPSNVHYHLVTLTEEGYIDRDPTSSRAMRVTDKGHARG